MDLGERYYELSRLGRETFCASVAPACLLQVGDVPVRFAEGTQNGVGGSAGGFANLPGTRPLPVILPLAKKYGTPFVDLVTVGRTEGNDVVIEETSISRFHAFFRRRHGMWFVCDAGSSNGTRVNGQKLAPRTEAEVAEKTRLSFGSFEFVFHSADGLYDALAARPFGASESNEF